MNNAFDKRYAAEIALLKWCIGAVESDPMKVNQAARLVMAFKEGVAQEAEAHLREPMDCEHPRACKSGELRIPLGGDYGEAIVELCLFCQAVMAAEEAVEKDCIKVAQKSFYEAERRRDRVGMQVAAEIEKHLRQIKPGALDRYVREAVNEFRKAAMLEKP
jgi:hypothetical protein